MIPDPYFFGPAPGRKPLNLNKNCPIGGLSRAKVLSIVLLFVVLLYPNGMTGKALIQEGSNPRGIETIGNAFQTPGVEQSRTTPETLRTDRNFISPPASGAEYPNHRATRLLAGLGRQGVRLRQATEPLHLLKVPIKGECFSQL